MPGSAAETPWRHFSLVLHCYLLERFRSGHEKAVWLLPGLFLVWVNTHGTFILGFFLMGVYWAAGLWSIGFRFIRGNRWNPGQRRKLELTFLLCLLASVVTPYGTRLAAYPLGIALFPVTTLRTNSEFLPIRFNTFDGMLFLLVLLLFAAWILAKGSAFRVEEAAIFLFATVEVIVHVRFILLFVPVFAPLLARAVGDWLPFDRKKQPRPVLNVILMCIAVTLVLKLFPASKQTHRAIANNFPVGAAAYMSRHPVPGPMFNEADWGGYLI